jgi:acyl transferase domain-containing protein/acyl carrier protein
MSRAITAESPDIAIIGMAGRFPGADNLAAFWRNLHDGVESISFFSDQELSAHQIDPAHLAHPHYIKAAAMLERIEWFDAAFFGYSPREAELIDPQHRVLLECGWAALEDAGYDAETYRGAIGVYVGASANTYLLNLYADRALVEATGITPIIVGNEKDFLATRLSYKLNLRGPSVAVQTACSTGLVAVHIACQSLLNYECDLALAGGVAIQADQPAGYFYQEGGIMSPDGHCRAFDAAAQGTIFGSGVGVVVLKRLNDALADGDSIAAVIKGSAINNDGALKVGYTAPSVSGQATVIAEALSAAGVAPATISYIEAHGTGTSLGDPIEIAALTQVFQAHTDRTGYCALGSVKTNVGHLDAAAGISGLIKTVLALTHRQLPPSLHFTSPNPQIDFANSPFYVNTTLTEWCSDTPRRAGVSSFGFGGTNAHVILEEAPARAAAASERPHHLLVLSAKTPTALERLTANLHDQLEQHPSVNLADVAFTLQAGRRAFNHRRALVCRDHADAITLLEQPTARRVLTAFPELSAHRPITFLLPGQGAQSPQMAAELYQTEPIFRAAVDRCAALLVPHLGLDIRTLLYPCDEGTGASSIVLRPSSEADDALSQTQYAQPALFVLDYALAQLWLALGVQPDALLGHSLGEYVAACLAGVLSLDDALRLVATRGRLMQALPPGAMLAVAASEDYLTPLLGDALALAAINGPQRCVVSGPHVAIAALAARLAAAAIETQALHTSHAFHSAMLDPMLDPFRAALASVRLQPPQISYLSNVSGTWITAAQATDPDYWLRHVRAPVRFGAALAELLRDPGQVLIEVGPSQTLSTLAKRHPASQPSQLIIASLPHAQDQQSASAFFFSTLAKLWLHGLPINWPGFYANEARQRIALPTYPFERERYWIARTATERAPARLGKKADIADWFYLPTWKGSRLVPPPAQPTSAQRCLVFVDDAGVGDQLVRQLVRAGRTVVRIVAGERFERAAADSYRLDPRDAASYTTLLKELHAQQRDPDQIVHLWSICADDTDALDDASVERAQALGFYSLLFLGQAIGELGLSTPLHLHVVTNHTQIIEQQDRIQPAKATLLGPCKVLPREYPLSCQCVDIHLSPGERDAERICAQLVAEIDAQLPDPLVAYRGRQRWLPCFEPTPLAAPPALPALLRPRGVYLITGGLGGIGLVFAEHLARMLQANLVLVGRTQLPARTDWDEWLATQPATETSRKIRMVRTLEELGAQVLLVAADVAQAADMRAVVRQACERFGRIDGVIHAAGVAGSGMIQLKSPADAARVLAPKLQGTLALYAACRTIQPDFILLCSSRDAIIGSFGQVDYCAANAFLDAFVQYSADVPATPVLSINWDVWQAVGMAVASDLPTQLHAWRDERIKAGLLPSEGVAVLERVLHHQLARVVVSTQDFQAVLAEGAGPAASPHDTATPARPLHARPTLPTEYNAPASDLEQRIAQLWQAALGIAPIGVEDNFFDLGGDSLIAVRMIAQLKQELQLDLPTISLYRRPTIRSLVALLEQSEAQVFAQSAAQLTERIDAMAVRKQYQQQQRAKKRG